jgi:NTP pyrophosphatase (non-canonical NTP hydrolase)
MKWNMNKEMRERAKDKAMAEKNITTRNMGKLDAIQVEQRIWAEKNFGDVPSWQPLLGVVEELGELAHAYLKNTQQIRMEEDHKANMVDAIGDTVIFLLDFCNREKILLSDAIETTWDVVKKRDWDKARKEHEAHAEAL